MLQMDISLREIMKLLFKSWKSSLWKSLNILYLQTDLWESQWAGEAEVNDRDSSRGLEVVTAVDSFEALYVQYIRDSE